MKSLCLTLFLFCQTTFNTFDFEYSNKKEFVQGITDCTLLSNTFVPPTERAVILISVAQAVLESNWGNSRFALEGNNFYGINYPSSVTFVFNDNPDLSKTFKTIEYEGFNGWRVDSFVSDSTGKDTYINSLEFSSTIDITSQVYSYDEGAYDASGQTYPNTLSGNIFRAGFYRKENKYYANLLNTSPPTKYAVHFGEQMTGIKGFYAVVTMSTDSSTDLGGEKQLFQVGTEYAMNNGYQ